MIKLNQKDHPIGTRMLLASQRTDDFSLPLREVRIVEWSPNGFVQLRIRFTNTPDVWYRPEALSVAEVLPDLK